MQNKQYKNLIFDLDDTLLDNAGHMVNIVRKLADKYELPQLYNKAYEFYIFETNFWKNDEVLSFNWVPQAYRTGPDMMEYVRAHPFFLFYNAEGVDFGDKEKEIREDFVTLLGENALLFSDTLDVLGELSKKYDIYIASNEMLKGLVRKIETAGIDRNLIKGVFSSEEAGITKPHAAYFDKLIEKYNLNRAESLMIGDHVIFDCEGAMRAGIDAVWVNRGNFGDEGFAPTYTVKSLTELLGIL